MKWIISAIASTMLMVSVAACDKAEPKVDKKDPFVQPYTEHIPRTDEGKKGERYFDFKSAKPVDKQSK